METGSEHLLHLSPFNPPPQTSPHLDAGSVCSKPVWTGLCTSLRWVIRWQVKAGPAEPESYFHSLKPVCRVHTLNLWMQTAPVQRTMWVIGMQRESRSDRWVCAVWTTPLWLFWFGCTICTQSFLDFTKIVKLIFLRKPFFLSNSKTYSIKLHLEGCYLHAYDQVSGTEKMSVSPVVTCLFDPWIKEKH